MVLVLEVVGALILVLAQVGRGPWWADDGPTFLGLSVVGSALLASVALMGGHAGFAFLFGVWLLVSLYAGLGFLSARRRR